jgi:hypothetical protein
MIEVQREISRAFQNAQEIIAAEVAKTAEGILQKAEAAGVSEEDLRGATELIRRTFTGTAESAGVQKRASDYDGRSSTIAGMIASLGKLFDSSWVKCGSCFAVPKVTSMKCTAQLDGLYDLAAVEFDLKNWSTVENRSTKGPGERGRFCPECATARGISADALQNLPQNRLVE